MCACVCGRFPNRLILTTILIKSVGLPARGRISHEMTERWVIKITMGVFLFRTVKTTKVQHPFPIHLQLSLAPVQSQYHWTMDS